MMHGRTHNISSVYFNLSVGLHNGPFPRPFTLIFYVENSTITTTVTIKTTSRFHRARKCSEGICTFQQ